MEKNCFFDSVDPSTFDKLLKEYPNVVPPKLTDLDEQRYETIPATLVKRASSGSPYLTKQEVAALVDWKLWVLPFSSLSSFANIMPSCSHACEMRD